jgi:hypothetical protein
MVPAMPVMFPAILSFCHSATVCQSSALRTQLRPACYNMMLDNTEQSTQMHAHWDGG